MMSSDPERADTLMSGTPFHNLDEVVTKAHLRAEIAELRLEVKGEFARLESRIELERLRRDA